MLCNSKLEIGIKVHSVMFSDCCTRTNTRMRMTWRMKNSA